MSPIIALASKEHLPALLAICREASSTPDSTWNDYYPNEDILQEDIEANRLFRILLNDTLVGVFAMGNIGELDGFAEEGDGDHPVELARLAVLPKHQGKSIAKAALQAALDLAREQGATVVRLLVAVNNQTAQAVYKSADFEFGKTAFMYGNDYYYARKRLF